jgi:hypothetical protein
LLFHLMLKLGDCYEDDARSIADYLRKAGIKVELKPSIDASIETGEFLQGLFSELKGDIKDGNVVENYQRYLNVLRQILESKPFPEDFKEKYLRELYPSIDETKKKLKAMMDRVENKEDRIKADDEQQSQRTGIEEGVEPADELGEIVSEVAKILAEGKKAEAFAQSVIALNDIVPGEDTGDRLDDPVVVIPVDLDNYGKEHPRAKRVISVYFDKCYELYIDEFSALNSGRLDDEFIKQYTDEHIKITSLNLLLNDLIENHSSEKMDLQTFEDECLYAVDSKNRSLRVVGYNVAEDIAKVLEKNGMIRIKGDTIRWKK